MKQYVDRPSGEPARRQACRSGVSAVAVEAFVNNAGENEGLFHPVPVSQSETEPFVLLTEDIRQITTIVLSRDI